MIAVIAEKTKANILDFFSASSGLISNLFGALKRGILPRGVLPSKRLLGMCHWMGSHFHNWTEYNGITFLVELLEWGRKFPGFLG